MLGLGLGLTALACRRASVWTPAALFALGQAGHWAGGYGPSGARLWQDAAGTVPATAPGALVGGVLRRAGSIDATQATALLRPTLARWPKGGRRNLLTWSEDFTQSVWAKSLGAAGVADAAVAPDSSVTADLCSLGELGASSFQRGNFLTPGTYTLSTWYKTDPAFGPAAFCMATYSTTELEKRSPFITTTDEWVRHSWTVTVGATSSYYPCINRASNGAKSFLMWGAQVEQGDALTPYQRVSTPYDITEEGVPDVWHLSNDGGDSLPVTLPAGLYGRAWVDAAGVVTVDSVTNPTNALVPSAVGATQADVILREGAFSPAEEAAIRAYWERLFA